jgi:type IV pilus assembly protein PilZ
MFLAGEAPYGVGSELVLIFELPGLGRSEVPAFVRWHRADGFGVQFGLIGARVTHAIGQLIRSQA